MRKLLAVATLVAVLTPGGLAAAHSNKGKCRRITRQIEHFEGTLALAKERDDELWADATKDHIARLVEWRASLCPEYAPPNRAAEFARAIRDWSRLAAKAAIKYLTGGWF